jgi:hypothetical protein
VSTLTLGVGHRRTTQQLVQLPFHLHARIVKGQNSFSLD